MTLPSVPQYGPGKVVKEPAPDNQIRICFRRGDCLGEDLQSPDPVTADARDGFPVTVPAAAEENAVPESSPIGNFIIAETCEERNIRTEFLAGIFFDASIDFVFLTHPFQPLQEERPGGASHFVILTGLQSVENFPRGRRGLFEQAFLDLIFQSGIQFVE